MLLVRFGSGQCRKNVGEELVTGTPFAEAIDVVREPGIPIGDIEKPAKKHDFEDLG